MLRIIYGIDIDDEEHEIIVVGEESLQGTGQVFVPGKYFVDLIPMLEYVPSWLPGAGWKRQFARWRDATLRFLNLPFEQRVAASVGYRNIYTASADRILGSARWKLRCYHDGRIDALKM